MRQLYKLYLTFLLFSPGSIVAQPEQLNASYWGKVLGSKKTPCMESITRFLP